MKNAQRVNCTTLEIVRRRGGWRRASFRFLLQRPEQKPLPGEKRSKMRCLCSSSEINFLSTSKRGVLGSPRHSPHLWFIPSAHLDFLAIFIIPSSHLDIHTLTSPRVQIILPPHLDRHTLTSPRGFVIPKGGKLY